MMDCTRCIHRHMCARSLTDENKECKDFSDESLYLHLPCALGDTVYVIEQCSCYTQGYAEQCMNQKEHKNGTALISTPYKRITNRLGFHQTCIKLFARPFKLLYLSKIGKTVFIGPNAEQEAREKIKEKIGE